MLILKIDRRVNCTQLNYKRMVKNQIQPIGCLPHSQVLPHTLIISGAEVKSGIEYTITIVPILKDHLCLINKDLKDIWG